MTQQKTSQNFTSRILAVKAATGQTLGDIAQKLGVTREHLYNYREGKHHPPVHVLLRLDELERHAGVRATLNPSASASSCVKSGEKKRLSSLAERLREQARQLTSHAEELDRLAQNF